MTESVQLLNESHLVEDIDPSEITRILKALSHPLRLSIVLSLYNSENNVNKLCKSLNTTQSNISQHLTILYESKVLDAQKIGVQKFYRLKNAKIKRLISWILYCYL